MGDTDKAVRGAEGLDGPRPADSTAGERPGVPELILETARAADLPEILAIETSSFPSPWSWRLFAREIEEPMSRLVVARPRLEEGNPLVGYVCWSCVAGEAHLLNLAVHRERRGRGIGRRLLRVMIDAARAERAQAVYLEMREENVAAARLYEAAGFTRVGRRRDYYGRGKNAIVMALVLGEGSG